MEAKKSYDLPSSSWRSRKAAGIIQPQSKGLRIHGTDGINPSLRVGEVEMKCPSSSIKVGEKNG